MNSFDASRSSDKKKVVFVMGATGTGKSKLSIDLATHFAAEIINSDKIQVYKGLDIVTNKVTESEQRGVPHHLLGLIEPEADFTADDFCRHTLAAINAITKRGRIPIIVGGSNTYIEELVDGEKYKFRYQFDYCFIWMDVKLSVLNSYVSRRVDQMVESGMVEEIRAMFVPGADNTKGIRRAIGVPEMDRYLEEEDEEKKEGLLREAIEEMKVNTHKLICCQLEKIQRLRNLSGWAMHRIDATAVFEKSGRDAEDAWEKVVKKVGVRIMREFMRKNDGIVEEEEGGAEFSCSRAPVFKKVSIAI